MTVRALAVLAPLAALAALQPAPAAPPNRPADVRVAGDRVTVDCGR